MSIKKKSPLSSPSSPPSPVVELPEILKALVHLFREQGHLTDDDINDVLPANMPDRDVDGLTRKLRDLGIKVVGLTDLELPKPSESEEDSDPRLDSFDDPVQMYMNKMSRVPLLTRDRKSVV